LSEKRLPKRIADSAVVERDAEEQQRIHRHDQRGDALCQPVQPAVVGADDDALHHSRAPMISVSARLTTRTTTLDWRAALSSPAISRSSNRKRMPAQK